MATAAALGLVCGGCRAVLPGGGGEVEVNIADMAFSPARAGAGTAVVGALALEGGVRATAGMPREPMLLAPPVAGVPEAPFRLDDPLAGAPPISLDPFPLEAVVELDLSPLGPDRMYPPSAIPVYDGRGELLNFPPANAGPNAGGENRSSSPALAPLVRPGPDVDN